MSTERSQLHNQVVRELIESKAIDFDAMGRVFSKYAGEAALQGESLVNIVNRNVVWNCGWPVPSVLREELERAEVAREVMG